MTSPGQGPCGLPTLATCGGHGMGDGRRGGFRGHMWPVAPGCPQVGLGLPLGAQALLSWASRCTEPQPEAQGLGCPTPSLQGDEVCRVRGPDQVNDRWKTVTRSRQTSLCR